MLDKEADSDVQACVRCDDEGFRGSSAQEIYLIYHICMIKQREAYISTLNTRMGAARDSVLPPPPQNVTFKFA